MKYWMIRMRALIAKELLVLFKNPKSRMAILIPPMMQLLIFGYAATLDLTAVSFAVLDHDRSAESRTLVRAFTGSGIFQEISRPVNEAEAADELANFNALCILVIPENFTRNLNRDGHAEVQALFDGRNSNTGNLALSYAQSCVDLYNRNQRQYDLPVKLSSRAWFNENYNMRYFMIPALLAMLALLDSLLMASLSIAREREDGTFDQLLVAPYSPGEVLSAKATACILVGLLQLSLIYLLARMWFHIPFYGSHWMLYTGFVVFLCSSVGSGLLISSLCANLQQAMLGTFLVGVPFVLLSGLATPIESMPEFFQYITLLNPMRYGIQLLQRLFLQGAGWSELWHYYAILSVVAALNLTAAYWVFRRQVRG